MSPVAYDLRVLVVAEDPLARAGLAALMSGEPGCSIVGQAAGGDDLSSTVEIHRPDVVLWDLGWDPTTAIERLTDLAEAMPPVVALLPDEPGSAGILAAGVRGLLLRSSSPTALAAALTAVAQGLVVLDPELTPAAPPARPSVPSPLNVDLTPREQEVLQLLAEGLPNKSIADKLGISEHTVKFHINSILGKLGAQSRTEAVTRATRLGLIVL